MHLLLTGRYPFDYENIDPSGKARKYPPLPGGGGNEQYQINEERRLEWKILNE